MKMCPDSYYFSAKAIDIYKGIKYNLIGKYLPTETVWGRHSDGYPHKSCMSLGHSDGRTQILIQGD